MTANIEPINGHYVHIDIDGRTHRIYFEAAGEGVPLLCLHTAGADTRQYRGVLNDEEVRRSYRVIAFDLPWHGKSSPPAGWETERYMLTTDRYVETVLAFMDAMEIDQPVVMGCSIGGRAVLHLSLRHGARFRAAIGLQSALFAEVGDGPAMEMLDFLHRPDVHGGEAAAGAVASLIAPQSPQEHRWETLWHYMQGGPGVFLGDLYYYFVDGDLRNVSLAGIDPQRCPLYLLTGEYDHSATPEMTAELAKSVGATKFEIMKGLGHFPMSENPARFLDYLRPVLSEIAEHAGAGA